MIKATYHFLGETLVYDWNDMSEFQTHYRNSKVSSDFIFTLEDGKTFIIPSDLLRNVELEEVE